MKRKPIFPRQRQRFDELVDDLKSSVRALEGRGSESVFDQSALHPGYEQLLHHLDRALHWAEEMQWIIETEFSGPVGRPRKDAA